MGDIYLAGMIQREKKAPYISQVRLFGTSLMGMSRSGDEGCTV